MDSIHIYVYRPGNHAPEPSVAMYVWYVCYPTIYMCLWCVSLCVHVCIYSCVYVVVHTWRACRCCLCACNIRVCVYWHLSHTESCCRLLLRGACISASPKTVRGHRCMHACIWVWLPAHSHMIMNACVSVSEYSSKPAFLFILRRGPRQFSKGSRPAYRYIWMYVMYGYALLSASVLH